MSQFKNMRILILVVLVMSVISAKAQTFVPGNLVYDPYRGYDTRSIGINDSSAKKKWFVSTYRAINTSFSLFNGGSATIISAPVGLQLNRRLNKNLFAFAGVMAAPAYVTFNRSFINSALETGQKHGIYQPGNLDLYSRAELGLQYVNDEKTFSISGSIGVERRNNPFLPSIPRNDTRLNHGMPLY